MIAYRCYIVTEIWCMTDAIVIFHFGLFFVSLPHFYIPQKSKFQQNEKKPWRYCHLTQVYQKS